MTRSRKALLSTTLIVAAYVAWILHTDADAVIAASSRISIAGITLICACSLLNYLLRFARWQWYLRRLGAHVRWTESLSYYLAGFALTTTPGKAGEAIRSVYLQQHAVSYSASLAALITERLADLLSVILIAALGLSTFPTLGWLGIALLGLTLLAVVILANSRVPGLMRRFAGRSGDNRWLKPLLHAADLLDSTRQLLGPTPLLIGTASGFLAWGAEAWALGYLLDLLGYSMPYGLAAAIYAISMLAGAVSFMPGGVGGAEAAMAMLLIAQGIPGPDAVAATLICRLCTLWFAVLIGTASMTLLALRGSAPGSGIATKRRGLR